VLRLCADPKSALQLGLDFALSRSCFGRLRMSRPFPEDSFVRRRPALLPARQGDTHSIRDVWFDEAHRLPFDDPSGILLDLRTNIGLTSV